MRASPEDMERISRILAGEQQLFHALIRPHERAVYTAALAVLRDASDAEDAAQETMLKAYRALSSFRGDAKLGTWLVSIAINESRNRLRARGLARTESLDVPEQQQSFTPFLLADWREIPSEALERAELAGEIERAVAALPVAYREPFLLRDKEEMSLEEIAEALDIKANLVKVRLYRARMLLQKQLAPYLRRAAAPASRSIFSRMPWSRSRPRGQS